MCLAVALLYKIITSCLFCKETQTLCCVSFGGLMVPVTKNITVCISVIST